MLWTANDDYEEPDDFEWSLFQHDIEMLSDLSNPTRYIPKPHRIP